MPFADTPLPVDFDDDDLPLVDFDPALVVGELPPAFLAVPEVDALLPDFLLPEEAAVDLLPPDEPRLAVVDRLLVEELLLALPLLAFLAPLDEVLLRLPADFLVLAVELPPAFLPVPDELLLLPDDLLLLDEPAEALRVPPDEVPGDAFLAEPGRLLPASLPTAALTAELAAPATAPVAAPVTISPTTCLALS